MILHSVYFWLDPSLTDSQKASFEAGLRSLIEIDTVHSGRFGGGAATPERSATRNTFDYALILEFKTIDDHNAYQKHPDHHAFANGFAEWFKDHIVYDTQF